MLVIKLPIGSNRFNTNIEINKQKCIQTDLLFSFWADKKQANPKGIRKILDKINYSYKNKLNIVPNEKNDIISLLKDENIIGIRSNDIFNISGVRKIIDPINYSISNIISPILKKYYPTDCDLPGDIYETIGLTTQYNYLLERYIGHYETIQKNFKDNLTRLFTMFQSDITNNISMECIGGIELKKVSLPTDQNEINKLEDINYFYEKYLTPYYKIIKDIGYLQGLGQYLTNDENPQVLSEDEYVEYVCKEVKEDIKNLVTLEEKINRINDFIDYFQNVEILMLTQSDLARFTVGSEITSDGYGVDPELINITFLMDGNIKNKDNILDTMTTIVKIINKQQEMASYNNWNNIISNDGWYNNFSFSYNYNEIWEENEIGSIISNFENIKNDYDNLYSDLMIFFEYFNTLINNLTTKMILIINNEIDPFILENTNFVNKEDVKNSIVEYQSILQDHYNILIALNSSELSIQNDLKDALIIINTLLDDLEIIDVFISDGAKEDDFNSLIALFNNSNLSRILYILTGDQIKYVADNFTPIPSTDYYSIQNVTDIEDNLNAVLDVNTNESREYYLDQYLTQISNLALGFVPVYTAEPLYHYTCFSSGSEVLFPNGTLSNKNNSVSAANQDGTVPIIVDNIIYYPQLKGLTNSPTSARNSEIPTIAGLKNILGDNFNKLGTTSKGNTYFPIYFDQGSPVEATNVVHGQFQTGSGQKSNYWNIVKRSGNSVAAASLAATKIFGAVYNDYAEYRNAKAQPGQCVIENGDGSLSPSTKRLQLGANIVSDTYGFAIGETNDATCPIAVSGRVLALPLEDKILYTPGAAVCSGPNGTISLMTREEIREWPDAIVGYVSEVPTYDTWGTDNVPVNGRIWIKIK